MKKHHTIQQTKQSFWQNLIHRCWPHSLFLALLLLNACQPAPAEPPLKVGFIAPFTGTEFAASRDVQRGLLLAIDEINGRGGVLAQPLELVVRDSQNKGADKDMAIRKLIDQENVVAIFGCSYGALPLSQIDLLQQRQIPFVHVLGTADSYVDLDDTSYLFSVSMTNGLANEFLARYAFQLAGIRRPGILAEKSAWGDAQLLDLTRWFTALGVASMPIEHFVLGDTNMTANLYSLQKAEADGLLIIARSFEAAIIMRGLGTMAWKIPVLSHSGTNGPLFLEQAGTSHVEGMYVAQTFSFTKGSADKTKQLLNTYASSFNTGRAVENIVEPAGLVQAYDGLHLLASAIEQANSSSGLAIHQALESLQQPYEGVLKRYNQPFSTANHDALTMDDYMMMMWHNGRLVPAPRPRLEN